MTAHQKRNIRSVVIHIRATFNNTIISVTDDIGNVVAWSSAGAQGFRGSKKATPYAAMKASTVALESALKTIGTSNLITATIQINGPGTGGDPAAAAAADVIIRGGGSVIAIENLTAYPFNGPRARKRRRV